MIIHLLFEQSGTFKREFKKLGFTAYDYDILNDFNETDFIIDLFGEIEKAFNNQKSIFDTIKNEDLIIAFFPCIRFEDQIILSFKGLNYGFKNWTDEQKMLYDINLHDELNKFYKLVNKLFIICIRKNLKLILENPYSEQHYLTRYWCINPKIIDYDRRENGDYFKKPTQYFFLNFEPKNNILFESIPYNALNIKNPIVSMKKDHVLKIGARSKKVARSMIHADYANRFIRQFIIEGGQNGVIN